MENFLPVLIDFILDDDESDGRENYQEFIPKLTALVPAARLWKPRISGYVETVIPQYDDSDFRTMFRISRAVFELLVKLIDKSNQVRSTLHTGGRSPIPMEKQVAMLAFYMGTQNTERQIADKFGVSESSVSRVLHKLLQMLVADYSSVFIRWPQGDDLKAVVDGFKCKRDIDSVVGAIDGSHIHIACPREQSADYVNRKGFHSVILQAVCDSKLAFRDIYVGWPGSVHDARVFANSPLGAILQNEPERACPNGGFLLGDAAYPLSTTLMTPFKDNGHLTREQTHYNFCHSSTRMAIERAFGLLKGRFRRLKMVEVSSLNNLAQVITAACILHNMCLLSEASLMCEDFIDEGREQEVNNYVSVQYDSADAKDKRNKIVSSLCQSK